MGLPRTGTTFLHRLLSLDPAVRSPLLWELLNPVPNRALIDYKKQTQEFQDDRKKRMNFIRKIIAQVFMKTSFICLFLCNTFFLSFFLPCLLIAKADGRSCCRSHSWDRVWLAWRVSDGNDGNLWILILRFLQLIILFHFMPFHFISFQFFVSGFSSRYDTISLHQLHGH